MSDVRHVFDEPTTREARGTVGDEKECKAGALGAISVAWCGREFQGWCFVDASHVLLALRKGSGIAPCRACLRAMRKVLDEELG